MLFAVSWYNPEGELIMAFPVQMLGSSVEVFAGYAPPPSCRAKTLRTLDHRHGWRAVKAPRRFCPSEPAEDANARAPGSQPAR